MKILLVYPAPPSEYWPLGAMRSYWVPTGIAYLARAMIRAGHDVRIHVREEHLIKNGFDRAADDSYLRSLLADFHPDMVGFSVLSPMVQDTAAISQWAKDICGQDTITVAGGVHPTALPEWMLSDCPAVDVAVLGEGEQTLVELAETGIREDIAGLVYRDGDGFTHTPPRSREQDLDSLGPPAYELLDMDFYTKPSSWLVRWLTLSATNIRSSRGCTNRCRFCAGHLVAGVGVRFHSIDYVIDQVHHAVDHLGVKAVTFEDDTFGADRDRLIEICTRLQQEGLARRIVWDCCLRVDQADGELLGIMKKSGCIQIEYGFEAGSDEALKRLGKNTTSEMNRRAVRLTREAGLRIFADIMFGLPGETLQQFKATVAFIRWAKPEVLSATRLCPLPGTPIFDGLPESQRGDIDWGRWTYLGSAGPKFNLTAMPEQQFEEMWRKFDKYLLRPQVTWALLRDSASNERPRRRKLRRKLLKFVLQHPIQAARLPW